MNTMEIRASQLREVIDLRKPTTATDAFNVPIKTFATEATVHAEVEEPGGREFYSRDQQLNEKRIRAKIWHRTDIDDTWQFIWNGNTFRIHDVAEIRPRRGLVISGSTSHKG